MSKLFKSRKFLLVLLESVIISVTVCLQRFLAPGDVEFVLAVLAPITAVITAMIIGIAMEDSAALKAGSHPNQE